MKVDARTKAKLMEIGAILRAARQSVGVSQAVLAERIGMQRENYLRIEHGRLNVTVETLVRIAAGLGVDFAITYSAAPAKPPAKTGVKLTPKRRAGPRTASKKQRPRK